MLDVPHLDARVKLRTLPSAAASRSTTLRIPKILWRFAAMAHPPRGHRVPRGPRAQGAAAAAPPKLTRPARARRLLRDRRAPSWAISTAILDFPGSWGLQLRHAHARASLIQSGVDPKYPIFGFDAGGPSSPRAAATPRDSRRQRVALRPRRHQPRRDDAGVVGRHLPGPPRRPTRARASSSCQGLLHGGSTARRRCRASS